MIFENEQEKQLILKIYHMALLHSGWSAKQAIDDIVKVSRDLADYKKEKVQVVQDIDSNDRQRYSSSL